MSKLNWNLLKDKKCPNCKSDMGEDAFFNDDLIFVCKCGFKINEYRYKDIVSDIERKELSTLQN